MRIFLAPMEGVVDHNMRHVLSAVGGLDVCVTEFVRVTDHTLPTRVFNRSCPELPSAGPDAPAGATVPVRVQLLGSEPEALASNARKAARLGAPAIDLNFGCPAKTVNRHRGGACLLDDTPLVADIVAAVREAVPLTVPVTAKIRLGYMDRDSYLRNSLAIQRAGATELCVHARSKKDGYNPPAYWAYIGEIRNALSIPVVANGEIWNLEDFMRCREQTGCDDFMLGRGLLARPDLALQIRQAMTGQPVSPMDWQAILPWVTQFFDMTSGIYPTKHMGNRLKQWLFYLQRTYPQAGQLFERIKRSRDEQVIRSALADSAGHSPQPMAEYAVR